MSAPRSFCSGRVATQTVTFSAPEMLIVSCADAGAADSHRPTSVAAERPRENRRAPSARILGIYMHFKGNAARCQDHVHSPLESTVI